MRRELRVHDAEINDVNGADDEENDAAASYGDENNAADDDNNDAAATGDDHDDAENADNREWSGMEISDYINRLRQPHSNNNIDLDIGMTTPISVA